MRTGPAGIKNLTASGREVTGCPRAGRCWTLRPCPVSRRPRSLFRVHSVLAALLRKDPAFPPSAPSSLKLCVPSTSPCSHSAPGASPPLRASYRDRFPLLSAPRVLPSAPRRSTGSPGSGLLMYLLLDPCPRRKPDQGQHTRASVLPWRVTVTWCEQESEEQVKERLASSAKEGRICRETSRGAVRWHLGVRAG